jgi:hypothetical protein
MQGQFYIKKKYDATTKVSINCVNFLNWGIHPFFLKAIKTKGSFGLTASAMEEDYNIVVRRYQEVVELTLKGGLQPNQM